AAGRDDDDVLASYLPDHLGADLLVAPAEQIALTADRRDDDPSRTLADQTKEHRFARVDRDHAIPLVDVDPEQRLGEAQPLGNRAGRRPRAHHESLARAEALDDVGGDAG